MAERGSPVQPSRPVQTFSLVRYRVRPQPEDEKLYAAIDLAVPVIDGSPLFLALGDRYPGIAVDLVAPPSRQWLGDVRYGEGDRAVVLDGICGEAGCCGVFARILLHDGLVVWSDFFARGLPKLPKGLRFEFDRDAYERTIAGVVDLPPMDWQIDLTDDGDE